ncbi:hypothetical protein WR25_11778 isoform B [Diploscapter pachys]|uniref:acireductone dioxygenase (Fe(2+)-requiring) n=1 Tax=Diploscapter pachys TaxID=2018661 RepID=A0A2A2J911_9BILA|nr:hypothetical protein WR25_11778 isoform B [Diploscapter pachys]
MPYFMPEHVEDQRQTCRMEPNEEATQEDLNNILVQLIHVNFDSPNWEEQLESIATKFDMNHRDEVTINPQKMPDYQKKLEIFFQEHMHCDAELRVVREGSGYFDVRSVDDRWIRIPVKRGDFVYLPPGIYHRFTPDLNVRINFKGRSLFG